MEADILIKNCRIVTSLGITAGNIYVSGEKIAAITDVSWVASAGAVIDAQGLHVLPGLVDGHVHMMDPGYPEREDFTTGTIAAAYGGVTTVIEHHRTVPPVLSVKELQEKIEYLNKKSVVDFGLKGGGVPENVAQLQALWEHGVTGFKMFTCELHHQPAMSPGNLVEAFTEIARFGGISLIHCEDDSMTRKSEEMLRRAGRNDYLSHNEWRSTIAEELAVDALITAVKKTGARTVVAHASFPAILDKVKAARNAGYPLFVESCPQYFHLTLEDLAERGPWVKFAPAVRDAASAREMWRKLEAGFVDIVSSDHCPFPVDQKKPGEANIWDAPNGIPGVETSLRMMLTGVNRGFATLPTIVRVMCENPAKIYGLYPKKGAIAAGSDADLVLVDMNRSEVLSNEDVRSRCHWTPYHGKTAQGMPVTVLVRGKVVVENRQVIGQPGWGRFVPRQKK